LNAIEARPLGAFGSPDKAPDSFQDLGLRHDGGALLAVAGRAAAARGNAAQTAVIELNTRPAVLLSQGGRKAGQAGNMPVGKDAQLARKPWPFSCT
jgi:hypothetical protein